MLTNFTPSHNILYNCLEDVLACLAGGFNRDHILMYARGWGFDYFPPAPGDFAIIGNRVEAGEYNAWVNLERFHGITSKCHYKGTVEEQKNIAKEELNRGFPVVFWLDGYYVPWTNVFKKLHMKHFLIAVDFDESRNLFFVVDPYWNKEINNLNYRYFALSRAKSISFSLKNEPSVNWKVIIKEALDTVKGQDSRESCFTKMRRFAEDASVRLELNDEVKGFEHLKYNCPLFMQLAEIFFRRLNFAGMLAYLGEEFKVPGLKSCSVKMKEAGEGWRDARQELVDLYGKKSEMDYRKKFACRVKVLADMEEEIAEELSML